jgi:hypothetical protein
MIVHPLNDDVRRIFLVQAFLTALFCVLSVPLAGAAFALAVLYGGLVALFSGWLAYRSVSRVKNAAWPDASVLFGGLTLRLASVIALFAIAFGVLNLAPLPTIAGFALAQLASGIAHFLN